MQNEREALSTVMDGELENLDQATIESISAQEDARATWARYHLIGDVLRDGLIDAAPAEFSEQLRRDIAAEPTVLAPPRSRPLLRPVAGFAIAASVATLAVIGIKQTAPEGPHAPAPSVAIAPSAVTDGALLAADEAATEVHSDAAPLAESLQSHRRLNSYLVKFNEQRSSLGVPGVNPYVRIVGFESD